MCLHSLPVAYQAVFSTVTMIEYSCHKSKKFNFYHKESEPMPTIDTSLLDLDRAPTLDELKAFFQKHDWSTAKLSERKSRSTEKVQSMNYVKNMIDKEFEKAARERGLPAWSGYFENKADDGCDTKFQTNPLMELRDNYEELISDAVHTVSENDELLDIYLSAVDVTNTDWQEKADEMFKKAIGLSMDVLQYREMAELLEENPAHEDFNQFRSPNFRREDFLRDWDHLRSKYATVPDPDLDIKAIDQNPGTEAKAISKITVEEYWKTIDEKDKIIIKMSDAGYTQNEIAEHLGMANNSGVSKRISKLQKDFERKTGIIVSDK